MAVTVNRYRREYLDKKNKDRERNELRRQLTCAVKSLKSRVVLEVGDMSEERQISLLTEYADRLELDADEFLQRWPDKDGQSAARKLRSERGRVLESIVKLKIKVTRSELEPSKPVRR
jgi:hypothetical protein